MILLAYIRVSTSRQELGPEAQRDMISRYASQHGHEVIGWHVEKVSGGGDLDQRHALMNAISSLSDGMGLVVAKRDRLSRDTTLSGMIKYLVRKKGAVVLSTDSNGNGDPYSEMLDGMLEVFAQFERALIRTRIKDALDVKRTKGEKLGGHVPYGMTLDADGKTLIPSDQDKKIINRIKRLNRGGMSVRQIAEKVTAEGYRSRTGAQVSKSTVARLLQR